MPLPSDMTRDAAETTVRDVLAAHARLPVDAASVSDTADLFQAGMTSQASVNVMLALEDAFDIEFPDAMLNRSSFESVGAMIDALGQLGAVAA